jgi:molybdenum cofactor cytidylyltransferase
MKAVSVSAIVLAAGTSSRVGKRNKLLLPFRARLVIQHTLYQLAQLPLGEIILVTGHEAEKVADAVMTFQVRVVYNDDFQEGMTSSIQRGVEAADPEYGLLICLGDMPLIAVQTYRMILEAVEPGKRQIVRPTFQGEIGHPLYFSRHFREEILKHDQPEGCRDIVLKHASDLRSVPVGDPNVCRDIDTMRDYFRLLSDAGRDL